MKSEEKIFNCYFFVIAFTNLCVSTIIQMFNSTITLHIDQLDYSASISGTIISIGAIAATVYRFFGGKLCEKRGRRLLIIWGTVCLGVSSFIMGNAASLLLIYFVRIFQMVGYSMVSTAVSVAVIDVIPSGKVGRGIGYFSLATSVSQAFGPSVALMMYEGKGGFGTVMTGVAVISLLSLMIVVIFLDYEKKIGQKKENAAEKPVETEKGLWKYIEKHALPAAMINFFIIFSGGLITMYLTLYASKMGIANAGMFFSVSVIFMIGARVLSGNISDNYGVLVALIPGAILLIAAYILLILSAGNSMLFYIAGGFYGLGGGLTSPALNAEAVRGVPKHRVSIASSTFFLPLDIAFVVSSVIWGIVIDSFSFRAAFGIAAGFVGAAMVLGAVIFSVKRQKR
ncbi:MAG: MFS transporter [Ruminococcus sp.]|uniref:MFS transporter n=1 Tax=Schaedlerella arabinosiphila TaxID=2044587 RepID=A0A3R8JRU3_9FIRM|nr:MFS transporter [Schaedlerella arabinosiphila]MCI8722484.1 MFS transporter [Ruminococcus sp.]RRK34605.1 MFS transporter [Schaedlerella arabinosiphila]